jgi:hypothetical protein
VPAVLSDGSRRGSRQLQGRRTSSPLASRRSSRVE